MRQLHIYPNGEIGISETNSNTTVEVEVISLKDGVRLIPDSHQITKEELIEFSKKPSKAKRDNLVNDIMKRGKTTMGTLKRNIIT